MEHFLEIWYYHTNGKHCLKTIDRLSQCYKCIVKVKVLDSQNDDRHIGSFFLFCNDKDIWSCIEKELRQVFAHNVKAIE